MIQAPEVLVCVVLESIILPIQGLDQLFVVLLDLGDILLDHVHLPVC